VTRIVRLLIVLLCFVVVLGSILHGCGKKGDPRPSGVAPPKAISDLKASLTDRGVVLRWTIQDGEGSSQRYRIERSELRAEAATCPGCPLQYAAMADITFNDPKLTKEKANVVTYLDFGIKAGYLYSYRVTVCDLYGLCSQVSNIGEVVVSPDYIYGKEKAGPK